MMDKKIHILIVEDEIKVIEAVRAYLERDGFEVSFALFGSAALNILRDKKISLLILDLMLPDMPGEEICRAVRKTSDIPIIMLTAKSSEEDRVNGLNTGADDYLIKPFSPRELLARVRAVLRRTGAEAERQPPVKYTGGLAIDHAATTVYKNGSEVTLTPNEYKILVYMSQNAGRCCTREQLMESAIGSSSDAFDRVVDSHIKNLRHKIEDNPRTPKYIVTQYGFGYKFGGSRE